MGTSVSEDAETRPLPIAAAPPPDLTDPARAEAISGSDPKPQEIPERCDRCKGAGPVRYAIFEQNIGAIVMRFRKSAEGRFCAPCRHEIFGNFTLITLVAGWWGLRSFFVTPAILVMNVLSYAGLIKSNPKRGILIGAALFIGACLLFIVIALSYINAHPAPIRPVHIPASK